MSGDGSVLIIGAQEINPNPGKARIYEFNGSEYIQKGGDLGSFEGNTLCGAVSCSRYLNFITYLFDALFFKHHCMYYIHI